MDQAGTVAVSSIAIPIPLQGDCEALRASIFTRIRPDLERIEKEIQLQLDSKIALISLVGRYILGSGGKRLRPLLMILGARLCGYQGQDDARLSVVFEFLHSSSLLHDDVVDHAEFRRSKPAANTIWGNPGVVLVGDYLYSKSILMTVEYGSIPILKVLSEATTKMAEGEVLQLVHSDDLELDERDYLEVITRKTAVLISAACEIGAIFGKGTETQQRAMRSYGHNLGIAFQLVDDTLDYTGDVKELGKPVGNDIQEGKATLPLIHALRNGRQSAQERLRQLFSDEIIPAEAFDEVRELVTQSGGIAYTQQRAVEHVDRAKASLAAFEDHPTKDLLTDIADYVIFRRT